MGNKILIKGGEVADGSGKPLFGADVLIEDDKIKGISDVGTFDADPQLEVIDAGGMVVCPGFIDMHGHSDFVISVDGKMSPKLRQGVTSVVIGSCGFSAAPMDEKMKKLFLKFASGMFGKECPFEWSGMGEYLERLRKRGIGANIFPQVGYGNLRGMVRGMVPGAPSEAQLEKMKSLLARALDEGGRGFSTGIAYPPQNFSTKEELVELCGTAASHGAAIYSTHIRNEMGGLVGAVEEAIDAAKKTGVSLQLSHHKAVLTRNHGLIRQTLEMIEKANKEGVEVEADVYPYDSFSNMLAPLLFIKEPNREDKIILLQLQHYPDFEGMTLGEAAKELRKSPERAAIQMLRREGIVKIPIAARYMSEEDVRCVISHPLVSIGSDGVESFGRKAHPRLHGTAVRVLEHYSMKEKVISLEEAVRKMTSMPAAKLKLDRRGVLREGYYADVVVFDPKRLHDRSDFKNPNTHPEGFEAVIVNGRIAVRKDRQTDALAGVVL